MRVQCERPEQTRRGPGDKSIQPTAGKQYVVLELRARHGSGTWLALLDHDASGAALFDAAGFRVISGARPSCWTARLDAGGMLSLAPEAWRRQGFWDAYAAGEPAAVEAFDRACDSILADDALDVQTEQTATLALGDEELAIALGALERHSQPDRDPGPGPSGAGAAVDARRLRARLRRLLGDAQEPHTTTRPQVGDPVAIEHAGVTYQRMVADAASPDAPFTSALPAPLLLRPLDGAFLTREQMAALAAAAASVGEREAYLTTHEQSFGPSGPYRSYLRIRLGQWPTYRESVERPHVLFSPGGRWAVTTRADGTAAVAGPPEFVQTLGHWLPRAAGR